MLGKILRIALIVFAVMLAMQLLRIDLTALTVLSGAVGVGIGVSVSIGIGVGIGVALPTPTPQRALRARIRHVAQQLLAAKIVEVES